jgi:hypothetical protein
MDRGDLLLTALALLCLAGLVLGVGGVTLLKRDRSPRSTGDTVGPSVEEDVTEER